VRSGTNGAPQTCDACSLANQRHSKIDRVACSALHGAMDGVAPRAEKTLLCLGFDELAAVAKNLDYKSLGKLSCVCKQLKHSLDSMVCSM
jgi:hypothetical protein